MIIEDIEHFIGCLNCYLKELKEMKDLILRLATENVVLKRKNEEMDKKIKAVKEANDKKMNKLVKEDIKRDKKCDAAMKKKGK